MKNKRRGIPRLFIVLSLALVGLMTLQVLLLNYAWDMKKQAFDRGVQSALSASVMALESQEIEGSAIEYFFANGDTSFTMTSSVSTSDKYFKLPGEARDELLLMSEAHLHERLRFPEPLFRRSVRNRFAEGERDSMVVIVAPQLRTDETVVSPGRERAISLRHVVGDWISRAPLPIEDRLDDADIKRVLHDELAKVGISTTPSYGVVRPATTSFVDISFNGHGERRADVRVTDRADSVVMASDNITDAEILDSSYQYQLFPLDPFSAPYNLVVVFPAADLYLFWQMWPLWLSSILFITVIIFSFYKSWHTNAEQRRFADQLVDFINNMTHEFKTPISTVGLAGEAIRRDDVRNQPEVLERYVGMIRDENERMHRQVEKILQMARFERGDIELKEESLDVHEILQGVKESFALRIEQLGGQLECELVAEASLVRGDRVHLESIFSNLVDNAVKYSPTAPLVKIGSEVVDGYLVVKVTDQGKGIARENQRRVFEKYYRCPTGNRHDVKGYGLGLSFVHSLVKAHKGFVELHSLLGQGTTVTVSLPLLEIKAEDEK